MRSRSSSRGALVRVDANTAHRHHRDQVAAEKPQFTTLRVKDAICDRMRENRLAPEHRHRCAGRARIRVPDRQRVHAVPRHVGRTAVQARLASRQGAAPLRENLAAGILRLTGWTPGTALYDPMCGSGTFLAEAAQIAHSAWRRASSAGSASKLKQYDITAWQGLKVPALDAKRAARGKRGEALGVYAATSPATCSRRRARTSSVRACRRYGSSRSTRAG